MTLPPTNAQILESGSPSTTVKDGNLLTPMPIADFMLQLGLVMQLPPKAAKSAPSPAETAKRRGVRTRLWLPAVAAASGIAFAASQLRPAPHVELPANIVGVWQTTDPRYAGRQLELTKNTIHQTAADGALGVPERISDVSVSSRGDTMALVIEHETEGTIASLNLAYVRTPQEEITLRNPAGVRWTRVREDGAPQAQEWKQRLTPPLAAPGKKVWEH